MAAGRKLLLLLALVCLLFEKAKANTYTICNNTGITNNIYIRRPDSDYCYLFAQTNADFSLANRTCIRQNGYLVKIESQEENEYIMNTYFVPNGNRDFWIGLTDQDDEGSFRWVKDNTLVVGNVSYSNWFGGSAVITNMDNFDCVKFTSDGWRIQQTFCDSSRLPYLCRQGVCGSEDGLTCYVPPTVVSSTVSPAIIAVVVVIGVLLIIVIIVTIFLVWLWKYRNDAFYRYILCCVYGGSKTQINNLKQENIRLRKELSQQKLNLNSSGRFQGQLTHQNSQSGMTSPKPPLSPDPYGRGMPLNRSFSLTSNKMAPPGGMISPQTSGTILPPPAGRMMGRSISNTSGLSIGSSYKTPPNLSRPVLPTIKNKITPISEEIFPTGDRKLRPNSAQSDSSESSSSTSSDNNDDKKPNVVTEEKPSDNTTTKESTETEKEPSSKDT